jgi:hypothetical protein
MGRGYSTRDVKEVIGTDKYSYKVSTDIYDVDVKRDFPLVTAIVSNTHFTEKARTLEWTMKQIQQNPNLKVALLYPLQIACAIGLQPFLTKLTRVIVVNPTPRFKRKDDKDACIPAMAWFLFNWCDLSPDGRASFIIGCTRICKTSVSAVEPVPVVLVETFVSAVEPVPVVLVETSVFAVEPVPLVLVETIVSPVWIKIKVPRKKDISPAKKLLSDIRLGRSLLKPVPIVEEVSTDGDLASVNTLASIHFSNIYNGGDDIPDTTSDDVSML